MHTVSVRESLAFGWNTFKNRPGILVGGFAVGAFVMILTSSILDTPNMDPGIASFIMGLASMVIGVFVEMGFTAFALRAHDSIDSVAIKHLWNPATFWKYLGAKIINGVIVVLGLILFIVPGIIAALGLMFSTYLVIDTHTGPIEALKESWRVTKGHKMQLFLLMLAIVLLNLLGFIALVIGLLVTVPVSMLAMAHAYRKLEHRASEVTSA